MVFEAVVVELLNKFLRQYVENLDTSQLKIGIWGGDVMLNDLKIKATLFDDLNLPVRVKYGKLGKLVMKIPWKNLYSSQVLLNIEELLLVIIPNNEFKYDAVKEEKWANDSKQAKLKAIEEARKRELESETTKEKDSFIEKLLTQIIKNIQIVICNIHIRFEDKTTIPNSPFSIGITLSNLSAQTTATDPSGYFSKMLKDNENYICKILNLEGLAIYWNSFSKLYSNLNDEELINILLKTIPKPGRKLENMYIFGPLTSVAFLRLNPKPETDGTDFQIPKIFVQIILKEIELGITHYQFCDCMALVEDSRRLYAANKYKKYRPVGVPVIGHAKEWWHFAYKCVAEDIIRRKSEWNWENIKTHRHLCSRYSELFKQTLLMRKIPPETLKEFVLLEKKLDLFNLILLREQVHVEIERNKLNFEKRGSKSTGWFSGWFGSRRESLDSCSESDEFVKKIQSVMTPLEKEKLFKAIGYEESAPPTKYPPSFVEVEFWLNLEEIKMTIYDDSHNHTVPILMMSIKDVTTEFAQRPSVNAFKLVCIVGHFQVIGKADKHGHHPELITSSCKKSESLIEVLYETKPLNASCDQRIHVNARPLRIVYHAETINLVRETFATETKEMEKIVAATSASLPTFQKITALGLQYAIEKRTILEVKVNLMSSYIIIPYEGVYQPNKDMLVIMLGSVTVETEENDYKDVSVRKLYLEGTTDEDIFSTVVSASYTKFKFELTGLQILFQLSGEDWVAESKTKGPSSMHFLESTNLGITIKKSLVSDDARIPKIIIEGTLPNVTFNLSEKRFVSFVALSCSIPTKSQKAMLPPKKQLSTWSIQSLSTNLGNKIGHLQKDLLSVKPIDYTQGIHLLGHFEVTEVIVNVSKIKEFTEKRQNRMQDENFLQLRVTRMGVDVTSKTFETIYLLKLGGVNFDHYLEKTVVPMVSTQSLEHKCYLLTVEYVNLDTKIPDFFTVRQAIVNKLTLNTTSLNILMNQEALLAQLEFVTHIQTRVDEVKKEMKVDRLANSGKSKEEDAEIIGKDEKKIIAKGKRFRKKSQKEVIDLLLIVVLEDISVAVDFQKSKLCEFSLKGTRVNIASRKSCISVDFTLKEIILLDLNPQTKNPKIMASLEDRTLFSRVTVYNKDYFGDESTVDITIDAEVCRIQLTFVNIFFSRAFEFLNAFQTQIHSIKEGATVAAQRAKENLIIAYQNQSQVCLNIQITAPILIIPRKSLSFEAIVLDMGVLTLKNTIHELDFIPSDSKVTRRPLIDTMKLNLKQLKIFRCLLNETSTVTNIEKTFVVPISLEITLKRNLSTGWFKVIPDLEIFGRLGVIHVILTHEDLCTIAGILRGNISEGLSRLEGKSVALSKTEHKSFKEKEAKLLHTEVIPEENRDKKEKEETSNYTLIKFVFFLDSFRFDATVENPNNEKFEGLATFTLETISLKGRMFSDKSIHTSIMLVSCLLDDTRPGKVGRLTRLMERTVDIYSPTSSTEENLVNSMIQVIYTKRDLDTFVDIRVYKFTLILSMDFIQKLGEFFTLDESPPPTKIEYSSKNQSKTEKIVTVEGQPTFTVNIRLEKPDIIIVENMDSINTDALIFHAEMVTKFRFAGSRQVINSTLTDIELYSCCFNPAERPYTLSQVIKPFTISVAGSTPEGRGLHVDICVTEISITVNPNTIDLLSKCYEALLKDSLRDSETVVEVDYSNLWEVKEFGMDDYWFLKPEEGVDALTQLSTSPSWTSETDSNEEICLLAIPLIELTVEGRLCKRKQNLLLLKMGFQMQLYNWSHKLSLNSSLTFQMHFYNKNLGAWEPVIEPVEENADQEEIQSYTPWELLCSVVLEEEGEIEGVRPPRIQVTLTCANMLQLTLTKTCLDVLKITVDTYTSAVKKRLQKVSLEMPPFIIVNKTGLVAELLLQQSQFKVCKALNDSYDIVKLESNSEVELQMVLEESNKTFLNKSKSLAKLEAKLFVKFPLSSNQIFQLPLGFSSKRYYPFPLGEFSKADVWGLVSDVSMENDTTTVILRSILRVQNDFNEPVNIHVLSENENEAEFVGTAESNSSFPLPFHAIYNQNKQLFFSVNGYTLSTQPLYWEDIRTEFKTSVLLQCNSKTPENNDPFFIQVVGEAEHIYYTNTKRKTMASMCFVIYLQPAVKIFNSLPVPLNICFQGVARERVLLPGSTLQITNAEPGLSTLTLRISDYLEKEWSCKEKIQENPPEYFIWKFTSYNGLTPERLNLGVRVTYKKKTAIYIIYCPFFMVNKTEHLLAYKFEENSLAFYHPGDYKQPMMFSPSSKKFFSKKSAFLQLEHSAWSDKFPIDVAGSGGTVACEDPVKNITYTISVTITLTQNNLTKIITFIPYYIFVNSTTYDIEYTECSLDSSWLEIPSKACVPFWPVSLTKEKTIQIRPKGSTQISSPFAYSSTDAVLLKLNHKCGGIYVNIHATNAGTYIVLQPYEQGVAPALILNYSDKKITIMEKNTSHSIILRPRQQALHTWTAPTGERKLIMKTTKHSKDVLVLDQDTEGLVFTAYGEAVRYVSFLDGPQRILLFTDEADLSRNISITKLTVSAGVEVICKIQGMGLSLVNDLTRVEILYFSFISSNVNWESKKKEKVRFKKMKEEKITKIEAAYQKYMNDCELQTDVDPVVSFEGKFSVNFETMEMIAPHHRKLRRVYEPGFWLAYRLLENQVMLHVKINRVQIDNQLLDCIFPIILTPVPPPKTVVAELKGPKPFFELSILKMTEEQTGGTQYKYFKILVQEFHVKVDIGFLQNMYEFMMAAETTDEEEKEKFRKELELTERPLMSLVEVSSSSGRKNFYELLHFSPLKIHFSFSLAGNLDSKSLPPSFGVILQSLGVTLTDVHDVVFRLSYFERKSVFLTDSQLLNEVTSHYYGQTIRQAYVLILGLDVIGNPFGLIVGIGEGVEAFFYEPFQGIVQGPSDFAEGVAIGCKRFFRGTVGSTAGTLEKLTGTLGKGLAVLSLDREYQLQRMQNTQRVESIQASMARGGRGLFMGVFEGVTGVVRKPIEGAKEEGLGGFFKGMGKGMMGLVTRPVSGVVDFASTSLNAVKRAAVGIYGNTRVRPPRFFRDECLIQPYNLYDALGNLLFHSLCKRRYCTTDKYEYHFEMRTKEFVILTNKRIILAEYNDTFDSWQEHMAITWKSMPESPRYHTKGVALTLPIKQKSKIKLADKPQVKILLINDAIVRNRIYKKMVELYNLEQEQPELS